MSPSSWEEQVAECSTPCFFSLSFGFVYIPQNCNFDMENWFIISGWSLAILFLDRSIFWSLHSYPFFLPDILFHAGRQKGWQEEALRAANRNCFDQFSPLQKTRVWKCLEPVDSLRCPESHHLFVMFFLRISQLVFRRLIMLILNLLLVSRRYLGWLQLWDGLIWKEDSLQHKKRQWKGAQMLWPCVNPDFGISFLLGFCIK